MLKQQQLPFFSPFSFPADMFMLKRNWLKRFGYKHPSIHFLPLNLSVGSRGGWSLSQQSSGDRRGTPWTGRQSITGPHRDKRDKQQCMHTFTPKDNLESSINFTCMFLDGGRKLEYPERTHAYTGRTC